MQLVRFEHLQAAKFADNLKTEHGYPDIETVTLDDGDEVMVDQTIINEDTIMTMLTMLITDQGLGSEDGDLLDSLLPLAGKTAIQVPLTIVINMFSTNALIQGVPKKLTFRIFVFFCSADRLKTPVGADAKNT